MNIRSDLPDIERLCKAVGKMIDFPLSTHGDFQRLSAGIEFRLREHISESTLERVWGYSTRGYETVSVRTLNVLARFAGYGGWEDFLDNSRKTGKNGSSLFKDGGINAQELEVGARILIGWKPDRKCVIRHLGNGQFIAEKTENSTMKTGDTFTCGYMRKGHELHLEHFQRKDSPEEEFTYIAGLDGGLTILEVF
ncbi:MAG: hypothetical protein ACI395_02650 [Candidatus Cryptobacteroides sp.]